MLSSSAGQVCSPYVAAGAQRCAVLLAALVAAAPQGLTALQCYKVCSAEQPLLLCLGLKAFRTWSLKRSRDQPQCKKAGREIQQLLILRLESTTFQAEGLLCPLPDPEPPRRRWSCSAEDQHRGTVLLLTQETPTDVLSSRYECYRCPLPFL